MYGAEICFHYYATGLRASRLRLTGSEANALIKLEMLMEDLQTTNQRFEQLQQEGGDEGQIHHMQQRAEAAGKLASVLERVVA